MIYDEETTTDDMMKCTVFLGLLAIGGLALLGWFTW